MVVMGFTCVNIFNNHSININYCYFVEMTDFYTEILQDQFQTTTVKGISQ